MAAPGFGGGGIETRVRTQDGGQRCDHARSHVDKPVVLVPPRERLGEPPLRILISCAARSDAAVAAVAALTATCVIASVGRPPWRVGIGGRRGRGEWLMAGCWRLFVAYDAQPAKIAEEVQAVKTTTTRLRASAHLSQSKSI